MRTYGEIAEKLEDSRYYQRLTQRDLAKKLGIKQPAVGRYASKKDMNVSTLIRWAAALGLEIVLVPSSVATRAQREID